MFKALALAVGVLFTASVAWGQTPSPPEKPAPIEVMVVGVFHMNSPGRDLFNLQVDDVLAPGRQAEIAEVTAALARFRPTKVAVEWPKDRTATRWADYRADKLPPSRNEVVQLGFRLARATGSPVIGVDAQTDFPFEPVQRFADANGQGALLGMDRVGAKVAEQSALLRDRGIAPLLRAMNAPSSIAEDQGLYMQLLRIGAGETQPGAELLSAWYRRNALICANLVQAAQPGDRMVVLYGAGHSHHLRRCVIETPGLRLVDPLAYLPTGDRP